MNIQIHNPLQQKKHLFYSHPILLFQFLLFLQLQKLLAFYVLLLFGIIGVSVLIQYFFDSEILFEEGIGEGIYTSDKEFLDKGLKVASRDECISSSDLVITNQPLNENEVSSMKSNSTILGIVNPFANQELINLCAAKKINLVSMEFIPRITRAQKMDVLSSQANLAGYAAVIESAKYLSTALPMMMTAAGTVPAARVFVMGAGVAGLQAIATARMLPRAMAI